MSQNNAIDLKKPEPEKCPIEPQPFIENREIKY